MNKAIARARRHQGGFTLIELLVVIVILGVLSGVVVFAVRGAGDKGKGASIATDERIVRTALEAYCAQKGHYPKPDGTPGRTTPMEVLVTDRFLSSASTIHSLQTGDSTLPGGKGNCPGDPSRYNIGCADNSPMPDCGVPGYGGGPPTDGICPHPDSFCEISRGVTQMDPTGGRAVLTMVALPSGKVLAFMQPDRVSENGGVSEYDPASGPYGSWRTVMSASVHNSGVALPQGRDAPVLIASRQGREMDDCFPNCGKIFTYDIHFGWVVYDPGTNTAAQVSTNSSDPGSCGALGGGCPDLPSAVQILGPNCDAYCGQVLIVYPRDINCPASNVRCQSSAELWNPKTMTFSFLGRVGEGSGQRASVVALPDSRVLVAAAGYPISEPKWTRIFDPARFATDGFDVLPNHNFGIPVDRPPVLENGDLFYGQEIFRWRDKIWTDVSKTTSCGGCIPLAAVDGGKRVLGMSQPDSTTDAVGWLFDPATETWTRSKGKPTIKAVTNYVNITSAVVITGLPCDPANRQPYCGKVVVAGPILNRDTAVSDLYTPLGNLPVG